MARQRIRVRGRDARLVGAIAFLSGIGAAFAGCSPTGSVTIDALLLMATVTACVWAAASAPWWAGVVVAAVATAVAPEVWLLVVGAAATVAGLAIGAAQRAVPWSRAVVAGVAVQVLARLGELDRFGLSALIAIPLVLVLAVLGLRRRPRAERRVMWIVLGSAGAVVVLAAAGLGIGALGARHDLQAGNQKAREALNLIADGDFSGAQASFDRAAFYFDRADSALSKPWTQLARVVPVLAQHRESASELSHSASSVTESAASALASVDVDSLRVVNGQIDTAAIAALEEPLGQLNASVDDLASSVAEADSPWLAGPLQSRLRDLQDDIERQQERGEDALAAVRNAPAMLGADGPRVYFIAFTTPAEARGLNGFMGNWAEVTITNGTIQLTGFGRTADLNTGGSVGTKTLSGPEDLLDNYGEFLLADTETNLVGPDAWSNITVSPDFPAVAQVIAELYPQSGGKQVDGVFSMDIETIARLMQISGPVQLDELGVEVNAQNVVSYLMREQYLLPDDAARVDALETVARTTVTRLLTSALPTPPDLAELLSPMTAQGRLNGWATRPEEEAVFERINMSGALPAYDSDALAITFNNAAANKIDDFLDATADYVVQPDAAAGTATATLTITLTNTAPSSGLPEVLIGNQVGLPVGTNSTYLAVYTALPVVSSSVDGDPAPFAVGLDGAYLVSSSFIDIPPGATVVVSFELDGALNLGDGYSLVVRTPPTARPFLTSVVQSGVTLTDGESGEPGVRRYSA